MPIVTMIKRYIANQLSHPSGKFGRLVMGRWLNTMNQKHNSLVLREMDVSPSDRVLEVGFGGGSLLGRIVRMVHDGSVDGIDISEEMVSNARIRFHEVIDSGRMRLHHGNAGALPFPDASFDKVCAVNTVYFWEDLGSVFDELFRVIRPGGRLVIGFTPPDVIHRAGFDLFGFTPYSADELCATLTSHGFSSYTLQSDADMRGQCFTLSATRRADDSAVESSGS